MSLFLQDVNLQQLPDSYLTGNWRVTERQLNRADPTAPLAQATVLHLTADGLRLESADSPVVGKWAIARDALLSRPYLQLEFPSEEIIALVTRLRRSPDGQHQSLTLYFQSGMELTLVQP